MFTGQHSEQAYQRGVRELRAFAKVSSPYLVKVYDAVLQDSFMYAMEYCPLGSLAAPARPLAPRRGAARHGPRGRAACTPCTRPGSPTATSSRPTCW